MSESGGTPGVLDGRGGRIKRACTTPFAEPQGVPPKFKLTHYHRASCGETRPPNDYTNPLSKGHAMKRVLLLWAATMLAVAGFARLASAQTTPKPTAIGDAQPVAVMLEQGIYQEETAGNLEAAAKTYRQIVEQAAVGRALVAQALARLAALEVRQKQLDEARQTIERLKTEYPEQKEAIAKAEALLPTERQNVASTGADHDERPAMQKAHVPTAEEKTKAAALAKQGWEQYPGRLRHVG
jgi:hypothetical protein